MMNVSLRQLRAFVAVAQTGGFSAAAQRLHLTQSALSMLVRALETEIGSALFERTTRSVKLTDAGREFFPLAERLLVDLHDALAQTRSHAQLARGRLVLAVTPVFATTVLPAVLAQYRQAHPHVYVAVRDDAGTARIQQLVQDGAVDLGIAPVDRTHPELLVAETLTDDDLVLACPIGHPLGRQAQVSWRDLAQHDMIGFTRDNAIQMLVQDAAAANGITLVTRYEVGSISTAAALVEAGLGISILPPYTRTSGRPKRLQFRPLIEPAIRRALCLMTLRDHVMSPAARMFCDMLRQHVREAAR